MADDELRLTFRAALDPPWTSLEPVLAGVQTDLPTAPAVHVTVERGGRPLLRIDVLEPEPAAHPFQDAIAWAGFVAIGHGEELHLVSLADRTCSTIRLSGYFGQLYPLNECLLVADADSLRRIDPGGVQRWRSGPLGVDGVLVADVEDGVIAGSGDWDPPGDWRAFRISLDDGKAMAEPSRTAKQQD